jgi:hypothetical protein
MKFKKQWKKKSCEHLMINFIMKKIVYKPNKQLKQ